jgi:hypothetical protein
VSHEIIPATPRLIERLVSRSRVEVPTANEFRLEDDSSEYFDRSVDLFESIYERIALIRRKTQSIGNTNNLKFARALKISVRSIYVQARRELEDAQYNFDSIYIPEVRTGCAVRSNEEVKISLLSNRDFLSIENVFIHRTNNTLFMTTEPIVIKDIPLGPFEVHVSPIIDNAGMAYALSPNPAISNPQVTHPNVNDNFICMGNGQNAYSLAVKQGRLCDAMQIAIAVVRTYGFRNPHLRIEAWHGENCEFCGKLNMQANIVQCADCHKYGCRECAFTRAARRCLPCHEHRLANPPAECYLCGSEAHNDCPDCKKKACGVCWTDASCRRCYTRLNRTCDRCDRTTLIETWPEECAECEVNFCALCMEHGVLCPSCYQAHLDENPDVARLIGSA